jgi:hypothetical protein
VSPFLSGHPSAVEAIALFQSLVVILEPIPSKTSEVLAEALEMPDSRLPKSVMAYFKAIVPSAGGNHELIAR